MENKEKAFLKKLINNLEEDKQILTLNSKVLIIDGLNTFLRNFSIINQFNTSHNHIGGLVGFLKSIGYGCKLINPTRVIIVFDGQGGSSSKKNLFPEYKANRSITRIINYTSFTEKEEEVESLSNQMARLIQYLSILPLDIICIDSVEADDIIGLLAEQYETAEDCNQVTIMSADQDFLQLVSPKIQVYSPTKKKIYQIKQVLDEYGVHPSNFLLKKTLLGDSGDNIPGINGLGPKKLLKLFPQLSSPEVQSLDSIFSISKKGDNVLHERILERKIQLETNFILMNLRDVPLSPENKEIIKQTLEEKVVLDKQKFLTMYAVDELGESIPNVLSWVSNIFNTLQIYRN